MQTTIADRVVSLYLSGLSTREAARAAGCSGGYASDVLLKRGVSRDLKTAMTAKRSLLGQEESVAARYQAGESAEGIGVALGVDANTVRKVLRRAGVTVRSSGESISLVEDRKRGERDAAFREKLASLPPPVPDLGKRDFVPPLSPQEAFWLGWLATDGCIHERAISLEIHRQDEHVVRAFLVFFGHRCSIGYRRDRNTCYTRFNSRYLVQACCDLGVTRRKSKTLVIHEDVASMPTFWLGAVEGDGTVQGSPYPSIKLYSASTAFLEQFSDFVRGVVPGYDSIISRGANCWAVTVSGGEARTLALSLLGGGVQPLLSRKWGALEVDHR